MYLKLAQFDTYMETAKIHPVSRQDLIKYSGASFATLKGLLDKGILELYTYEIGRLHSSRSEEIQLKDLSPIQNQAYRRVLNAFSQKDICLLHGVTSSGKTEVYTHLISEVLKARKQVLYHSCQKAAAKTGCRFLESRITGFIRDAQQFGVQQFCLLYQLLDAGIGSERRHTDVMHLRNFDRLCTDTARRAETRDTVCHV